MNALVPGINAAGKQVIKLN